KKRIMIIGAGPAGMECAMAAKQRGHEVTVFDREDSIGGLLRGYAANDLANRDDMLSVVRHYEVMAKKLGIEVKLGVEVTPKLMRDLLHQFDVAIVAAGARNDENMRPKTADGGVLTDAYEVALGRIKPGKKVVVIGGGRIGLTLAESLTDQGHEAIIVESSKRVGNDVAPTWKWRHTSWIKELKIPVMTSTRVTRVTASSATVVNAEGEEKELAADMVIYAAPQKPNQEVFQALQWMVDEVHMIGDAMAPRGMTSAIHDGYRLGCRI
ncbi:MAG TPA: FAD-dependent oxidoreductase, partial [Hyphomicrobiales bacterium]|nr:FAD-dependent oxidoreductase [Hyphomicrobiales bacterium]